MPAKTFFALLSEGNKLDVLQKRFDLTVADYPWMDEDNKQELQSRLRLPDDVLDDILESEATDDISTLKDALEG